MLPARLRSLVCTPDEPHDMRATRAMDATQKEQNAGPLAGTRYAQGMEETMSYRFSVFMLLAVGLAFGLPGNAQTAKAAEQNAIRIATLAPRSSDLVRGFTRIDHGLREMTKNKWGLKLYPSGVAGDETDVIRKMRVGQIDGTVVTSVGLSQVLGELAVVSGPGAIDE
jgi:TRAP-type C4-dicarboxylate transport system substrate-binding protein